MGRTRRLRIDAVQRWFLRAKHFAPRVSSQTFDKENMDTPINEAFARLNMLEFAIEVVIANQLADRPIDESKQFKDDFVRVISNPILPVGEVSSQQEQTEAYISERVGQMAKRLMDKVGGRENEIRDRISPA